MLTADRQGCAITDTTVTAAATLWAVKRHSGRVDGEWRTIYEGDEQTARARFAKVSVNLRQGGVRLFNPEGENVDGAWAPRLRTRW